MAGRTRALMIDPNDENRLWIGTATGGMWYNPDFRDNAQWVPISDDWESMSISSLAYDPVNPSTFYAGTGESFTSVPVFRESSSSPEYDPGLYFGQLLDNNGQLVATKKLVNATQ
ncbi:MAG: hypothetical protein R8G66_03960 [Cytophagales bacterium]|nr:hypothetical protein [Cytophagales bacterium]